MDLDAALEALVTAAAGIQATPKLVPYSYMPLQVTTPAIVVTDTDIVYDETFARGMDAYTVVMWVLADHSDDKATSQYINGLLHKSGPASFKTVIEADRTLGGTVKTLRLESVRGRRLRQWSGSAEYLGIEIITSIWG